MSPNASQLLNDRSAYAVVNTCAAFGSFLTRQFEPWMCLSRAEVDILRTGCRAFLNDVGPTPSLHVPIAGEWSVRFELLRRSLPTQVLKILEYAVSSMWSSARQIEIIPGQFDLTTTLGFYRDLAEALVESPDSFRRSVARLDSCLALDAAASWLLEASSVAIGVVPGDEWDKSNWYPAGDELSGSIDRTLELILPDVRLLSNLVADESLRALLDDDVARNFISFGGEDFDRTSSSDLSASSRRLSDSKVARLPKWTEVEDSLINIWVR